MWQWCHMPHPSTWEAEADGFLSLRTARPTQRNPVSEKKEKNKTSHIGEGEKADFGLPFQKLQGWSIGPSANGQWASLNGANILRKLLMGQKKKSRLLS